MDKNAWKNLVADEQQAQEFMAKWDAMGGTSNSGERCNIKNSGSKLFCCR